MTVHVAKDRVLSHFDGWFAKIMIQKVQEVIDEEYVEGKGSNKSTRHQVFKIHATLSSASSVLVCGPQLTSL